MLSATLESGLRGYDIGGKVRALRLRKKMGLVELGRHTGLSPAMLSKIERGRLYPTLRPIGPVHQSRCRYAVASLRP